MADMPLRPVRSRIAIKSALDNASAPRAASRSRGRSWIGRSWMRTLAFIGRAPMVTTNGPGSEGKISRAEGEGAYHFLDRRAGDPNHVFTQISLTPCFSG